MKESEKDLKREQKYSTKPIREFSSAEIVFKCTFNSKIISHAVKLVNTILSDFFFLQYAQKFHITKRKVINVEDKIDSEIPFCPEYVKTYSSFVNFFLRPLTMLTRRLGLKKAIPYCNDFLDFVKELYKNSAKIYRFRFTTTNRPKYYKNFAFKIIHIFDPHLLCVPSLHVAIACGTYIWYKRLFEKNILPGKEQNRRLEEIRLHALAITESVLLVKQHSVNCIPSAIYLLCSSLSNLKMTTDEAIDFMNSLFKNCPEISSETRKKLTGHFNYIYERNFLENVYNENWEESLKRWLLQQEQNQQNL